MATNTSIEWTERPGTISATLNPTTGCDKISAGDHCDAQSCGPCLHGCPLDGDCPEHKAVR